MKPPSKAKPSATKTPLSGATVISAETFAMRRDVRLAERALAGDIDAAIEWLNKYGGDKWRPTA